MPRRQPPDLSRLVNPRLSPVFQSRRGFTLLEILIATAIGAIVLLVINATFFGALRLHNTTHDRIDSDLALQRTLGIVRKDLAGIMLPGGVLSGQLQTINFSSSAMESAGERVSPDIFTNSGKIDGWTPFSEVQTVAYFLAPAADGGNTKSLVRVVTRNLLPAQAAITEQQTLLSGVVSAGLEFYSGSDWTDTWDSTVTASLPSSLKFRIVLATSDATATSSPPIELIVPVVVATASQQPATGTAAAP